MDLADVLTTIPLPTIVLALASLAFLCFFLITTTKSNKHGASPSLPPPQASGSWPIIGHLHLLGGPRPPHRVLGQMADQHGPIFTIRMGVHPALVVSSWEIAKECLTTHDRVFADRPATLAMDILGYHRSMFGFSPYGSFWRETRKMATLELLSSHRLDLLQHVRESEVRTATKELYAYWQAANKEQGQSHSENLKLAKPSASATAEEGRNGGVSVEMSSWFGEISMNVILRMIAGKSVGYLTGGADSVKLSKLLKEFFELTGRFVVADGLPYLRWLDVGGFEKAMRKTAGEMDVVVEGWLREHKAKRDSGEAAETEKDFMDVILDAVGDQQDIDGRDAATFNKATSLGFVLAASDTTLVTMTWLLSLLVNHPDVLKTAQTELHNHIGKQRRVQESDLRNLDYLKAIVKETLRLYPPGPISLPHQSIEDCTVAGRFVRKGTRLIVNIYKIQRDPRVWPDPDEFRPDRFLTTHKDVNVRGQDFELIPFGSGRRMCPGVNFALRVMHLTLATLLHGFNFDRLGSEPVDMTEGIGLTVPRATPLDVLVSPRLPPHLYE